MDILSPLFVQVALTFLLLFAMGRSRVASIKTKKVRIKDIALRQQNWTEKTTQIANSFHNQLETPVLFYLLVLLLIVTKQADYVQVVLAWIYVIARVIHALIHVTNNNVNQRFFAFLASIVILAIMWVKFFVTVTL